MDEFNGGGIAASPAQYAAENRLKDSKPSLLDQLLNEQIETSQLVNELESRLRTVSNPEPQEDQTERSRTGEIHLENNLYGQRLINSKIRYILRTLAL